MPVNEKAKYSWPERVGILAMELYVPSYCVDQTVLETYDGASAGKYTIGLGQTRMGFCDDREDINSLCMTVLQHLVERNQISYKDIGRLEVGTETIIDKSKSVKTALMQLFSGSGNHSVEGIDTTNACYGGTAALFNAVAWVESSAWDGRYAVVVAGDIAVYASGNARPTGGAGAVAMLIGPNAPLYVESNLKGVYMDHAYDFYKPNLSSEYPTVDGKLSIQLYLQALDCCYQELGAKYNACYKESDRFSLDCADWFAFHSPFTKLVQKSLARLLLNDFMAHPKPDTSEKGLFKGMDCCRGKRLEDTLLDKEIEKACMKASEEVFHKKTVPSLLVAKEVGNMYTASLYGGIVSLLSQKPPEELVGTRLVAFSYGSGLASTLYALKFSKDLSAVKKLSDNAVGVKNLLLKRTVVSPQDFEKALKLREEVHHIPPCTPTGDVTGLFPGTYYLTEIDDKYRRKYSRVPVDPFCNGK